MEEIIPPLELFWELSEIIHVKCSVSIQEAPSIICPYCTEWGIITSQLGEEGVPELGDAEFTRGQEAEGEEREYFEATKPVMSCAQGTWRICSQEWRGVEVRLGKWVGTRWQGCGRWAQEVWAAEGSGDPPKVLCGEWQDQSQPVFTVLPMQAWPSDRKSSTPHLRLWSWPLLLFTF